MMDDVEQRITERRRELTEELWPALGADAACFAGMMIVRLRRDFGGVKETNQLNFLVALELLPGGSRVTPRAILDQHSGRFRVVFLESDIQHRSLIDFASKDAADAYGGEQLQRLRGEINKPD